MPQPDLSVLRFGGRAVGGSAALMPRLDLNDGVSFRSKPPVISDAITVKHQAYEMRGASARLGGDFLPKTIKLTGTFDEAGGTLIADAKARLTQSGEQWLTTDNKTQILAEFVKFDRTPVRYTSPYAFTYALDLVCRRPFAEDILASGSLPNLLNPYGGFEGPAVQPTLYGSTVIQSNDFETAPATTDYFHSIGTEALGTLAAWNQAVGSWSIASNVVTAPAASGLGGQDATMAGGHADWQDFTFTARFQFSTNSIPGIMGRWTSSSQKIRAYCSGTSLAVDESDGGYRGLSSVACALTNGTWYWLKLTATGTAISATVYADSAGSIGAQVATTSGTATFSATKTGQVALMNDHTSTATCAFGGAFANVCYVTGPAPTGWSTLPGAGWAGANEPAFCWSQKQAYYGAASLSAYFAITTAHNVNCWQGPTFTAVGAAAYQVNAWTKIVGTATSDIAINGLVTFPGSSAAAWTPTGGAWTGVAGSQVFELQSASANAGATIYFDYATIVQPNTPTGVLFNSLGGPLDGFTPTGTLNAWTAAGSGGTWTIAANKVTPPLGADAILLAGHSDWWDSAPLVRVDLTQDGAGLMLRVSGSGSAVTGYLLQVDGGSAHLTMYRRDSNGTYTSLVSSGALSLTGGSSYWLRFTASGSTLTGYLYKDAGGYIGDQIQTVTATDATYATGQAGLRGNSSVRFGGNYPGTFLVQGPLPAAPNSPQVGIQANGGEPAFCWSKNGPKSGTYSMSVYLAASGSSGDVVLSAGSSPYALQAAAAKRTQGDGKIALFVFDGAFHPPLVDITPADTAWHTYSVINGAFTAGSYYLRAEGNTTPTTIYWDEAVLQSTVDSTTGLRAGDFVDQIPLAGSTGAGTSTVFPITYSGSVLTRPVYVVTIPVSNAVTITSIKLQNTTRGEVLTITPTTPLAAGTRYVITIDAEAQTITDQLSNTYDPVGTFPKLAGPAGTVHSFTATVVTGSGTSTGVTLDTQYTNRWEL